MKNLFFIAMFLMAVCLQASNPELNAAVNKALNDLHGATSHEDARAAVNQLERIKLASPTIWQTHYHHAYGLILLSHREKEGLPKDQPLDKAEKVIEEAVKLQADKAEIWALRAMVCQARIAADPSRGMTYSGMARGYLLDALQADPANPRALFLMGQNLYHTPEAYGGGSKVAKNWFQRSVDSFTSGAHVSDIHPAWGKQAAMGMLQRCLQNE